MRVLASRKGFSLVELLTVIAIIAILAAIIFPVMGMVKNNANRTKCITQLQQIGTAMQTFKQDNRRYPDILGATVQTRDGNAPAADLSNVIGFDQRGEDKTAVASGLFPEYTRTARVYHCPMSKDLDTRAFARYDPGPGAIYAYTYNSYDCFYVAGVPQQHYSRGWAQKVADVTGMFGTIKAKYPAGTTNTDERDYERQLKFRTPPEDTVVTWCSWHELRTGASVGGRALVLFLDCHVDALDGSQVDGADGLQWCVMPKKE